MLWHPRCRWPARLSLSPTPQHALRKNATPMFPALDVLMGNAQARRRIRLGFVTITGAVTKLRHPYRRFYLCSCYGNGWVLSALPPKADKQEKARLVRFVPKADYRAVANGELFDHLVGMREQRRRHSGARRPRRVCAGARASQ